MITTSDAGTCLMIRGESREEVEVALRQREQQGYRRQGEPGLVGKAWIATCAKPALEAKNAGDCNIERLGHQVVVRGPTEYAVRERMGTLTTGGAKTVSEPQQTGAAEWTAILDAPR